MSAPAPPVALTDHCSIVHDGVLYVYSPHAFQTLELRDGAQWQRPANGVAVTGAVCVKGGVDGDNSKPALYVVGGAAVDAAAAADYAGLQRYSIADRTWQTLTPVVPVTQNRRGHGGTYLKTSSALVVYGGSQDGGDTAASSETFLMDTFPPYRVAAYSSDAPPTLRPFMLPWSDDRALMVGGNAANYHIFTFGPADGWQDLGLSLPAPLPDPAVAQAALFTLDDNSKIMTTFDLGQAPPSVSTLVLLNPGGLPAVFGETVGGRITTAGPSPTPFISSSKWKRNVYLNNYPTYNDSRAPAAARTHFDLAQDDGGFLAFVGGNDDDPVVFFNQSTNTWIPATQLLGEQPASSPSPSPSPSSTGAAASATPTHRASSSSSGTRGLTILGAVLGSVCGVAAILIILLLWLRSVRRRRAQRARQHDYAEDKRRSGEFHYEEGGRGRQPLSQAGQPMGRSPVPSAVITEADSTAMFGAKGDPKYLIRRVSSDRAQPGMRGSGIGFGQALFKRDKPPLTISKPMNPTLGDYQDRPSIELGRATPAYVIHPAATAAAGAATRTGPGRATSQRKTNEGWGSYFKGDPTATPRAHLFTRSSKSTSRSKSGGFWPGSGVPESSTRSPKIVIRDSVGNPLEPRTVAAGSPSLEHGPSNAQARGLQAAQGVPGHISRASSFSSAGGDEEDYEDEQVDGAFSSGVPASVQDVAWTPVGNTWSGPAQRPLRPPASYVQAQSQAADPGRRPAVTSSSNETARTSDTHTSSIPSFPMPSTVRSIQPSGHLDGRGDAAPAEARDYFGHGRAPSRSPDNTDMSWLNLGTPHR